MIRDWLRSPRLALPWFLAIVLIASVPGPAGAAERRSTSATPAAIGGGAIGGGPVGEARRPGGRPATGATAVAVFRPHSRVPLGPASRPRPELDAAAGSTSAAPTTGRSYRGTNHVWIPALGIDRAVALFPCDRTRPPDNLVYRWGCAGTNNVYLLGHAYSVFEPLHDAYVGGRLKTGLTAHYADASGRVRSYSVAWWKVTRPTPDAKWAWAPQATPSMTLQTCVGRNSEYRLMVRLVQTD